MVLKFWNSNLNILCDTAFIFFNKMPTLWSSEVNWVILEQVEKWRNRIMIICFNFLRNKNYVHKTNSRNSALYKFHIKIYLESFVSIYHSYHLFGMIYKSISCNFSITLNYWFISKTINIRSNFICKCPLGDPIIPVIWHSFSFFSVITIIEITSLYFRTQMLQWL